METLITYEYWLQKKKSLTSSVLLFRAHTVIKPQKEHFFCVAKMFFLQLLIIILYSCHFCDIWNKKPSHEQKPSGQLHIFECTACNLSATCSFFFQNHGINITAAEIILTIIRDYWKYLYFVSGQPMYGRYIFFLCCSKTKHNFAGENIRLICKCWCIFIVMVNNAKVFTRKPLPVKVRPTTQFSKNRNVSEGSLEFNFDPKMLNITK